MANIYNSAFTGEHNDEYDSRINAKVSKNGDTMTGQLTMLAPVHIGENTDNTYRDLAIYRLGTNDYKQCIYMYNSYNGTYSGIIRSLDDTTSTELRLYDNAIQANTLLQSSLNNNTVSIGSQNTNFCHIYNSANIPFIFNNSVASTNGTLGTSSYPWNYLYLSKPAQITRVGSSTSWVKGRDCAILRNTTIDGYSPSISIKTTAGSWQIGAYNESSYANKLIFSYTTDTNYSSNTNNTVNATITAAGAFTSASKRELKENIQLIDYSCLDIINSIQICSFNMKDDPEKDYRIGFIADDTDIRVAGKNHDLIDLQNCIGVLIKAVQELSQEVQQLKQKIN